MATLTECRRKAPPPTLITCSSSWRWSTCSAPSTDTDLGPRRADKCRLRTERRPARPPYRPRLRHLLFGWRASRSASLVDRHPRTRVLAGLVSDLERPHLPGAASPSRHSPSDLPGSASERASRRIAGLDVAGHRLFPQGEARLCAVALLHEHVNQHCRQLRDRQLHRFYCHYGWRRGVLRGGVPGLLLAALILFTVREHAPRRPHDQSTSRVARRLQVSRGREGAGVDQAAAAADARRGGRW